MRSYVVPRPEAWVFRQTQNFLFLVFPSPTCNGSINVNQKKHNWALNLSVRERERERGSMRGGMSKEERSTASWVKATPTLHEIKARPAHILPLTYKASVAQRLHTAAKSFIQPALTPRTESK